MNFILKSYALQNMGKRSSLGDCFYPPFLSPCHYDDTDKEWCFYDGTARTDNRLFIVSDGKSDNDQGEQISQTIVASLSNYFRRYTTAEGAFHDEVLRNAATETNIALHKLDIKEEQLVTNPSVALLKFHANGITIGHVGNARIYQFRSSESSTTSTTFLHKHNSQILFKTEDSNGVEIDHITDIKPKDVFLVCTDGIYEKLSDNDLCQLLCDKNNDGIERVQSLLQKCLCNEDNNTAIVVLVDEVLEDKTEADNTDTLSPGSVVSSQNYSYHIERKLGQGAFGVTYLVKTSVDVKGHLGTIHTDAEMCLKEFFMHKVMKRHGSVIDLDSINESAKSFSEKFRDEAAKVALLSHPHIVNVMEVFKANNTYYYSMEYFPQGTLGDYIYQRNGLPEKEAIKCIRQIGSALSYMHANKMLHLDVKPSNVMLLDGIDNVKLIDFGIAKRYDEKGVAVTSASLGSGTTGYAPIEQFDSSRALKFSPQIDVYSLGATYYKILTDEIPASAFDILNEGLDTMPLVRKNVSHKSIDAIVAAMQPLMEKRLRSVKDFIDMLPRIDNDKNFKVQHHSMGQRFLAWWQQWK